MPGNTKSYNVPTDQRHRFRLKQTWLEIKLSNGLDEPIGGERCIMYPKTGDPIERTLDDQGFLREEPLAPGTVLIEFPDWAEVCLIEDGKEVNGPGRDVRVSRGNYERHPSEMADIGTYSLDADDDDDIFDEQDDEEDEEDDELTREPDIGGSFETSVVNASGRGYIDLCLPPVDVELADSATYTTAQYRAQTGKSYHFAVLMCIAVEVHSSRVIDDTEPLGFHLATASGEELCEDEVDDWFIFYDAVGVGDYELTIAGETIRVPSVARATEAIVLSLDDLLEREQDV